MAITCEDRVSGLPQPILQHILCFLCQKEAVRTCVLSKSWRHQWCTRPKVQFCEKDPYIVKGQTFLSVVDKTLQRYHDQNLSIHELRLKWIPKLKICDVKGQTFLSVVDKTLQRYHDQNLSIHELRLVVYSRSAAELLRKWIPKLKICDVYLVREGSMSDSHIQSSIFFEAASLENLYLERCTLDQKCVVNVLCKNLKKLHLVHMDIEHDETFRKIMSSCPLIESVTIHNCRGLSVINVDDKLRSLKHFDFNAKSDGRPSIEIGVPSIERIKISGCPVLFRNDQRNLKSLSLTYVRLSNNDLFSCNNMPSLEFLELTGCYGLKELHLSSRSIKHFVFRNNRRPRMDEPITGATIDAPNILVFLFSCYFVPSVFSFTTTDHSGPHGWKSNVKLTIDDSLWFQNLYGLLKELSGSDISLKLYNVHLHEPKITGDVIFDKKPVVVKHLQLRLSNESMARLDFVNELFSICHPRILQGHGRDTCDFVSKFLKTDTTKNGHYFWQQDLEDVSMDTFGLRLKWKVI